MCTLTDISIIAEWIFFKVTKDLLCLHKSDGSGKFGQAHGQYLDLIWASPRAIRLIIVNVQWHVPP